MKVPYTTNPRAWDCASRSSASPAEYGCALDRPTRRVSRTAVRVWAYIAILLGVIAAVHVIARVVIA